MGRIGRGLLWLLIIGGFVYGVYFLYAKWWDFGRGEGTLSKAQSFLKQKTESVVNETVSGLTTKASDLLKAGAAEVIAAASQGLASLARSISSSSIPAAPLQNIVQSGNNFLPFPTSSGFSVPPPPAAITAQIGMPLVFAINAGSGYKIDWGDGQADSGAIPPQTTKLVNHTWSTPGDYVVQIDVKNEGSDSYFSFPIRVYAP